MQSAFGFLAEILSGVIGLIQQAMDPNTELGESVAALGIQFESLFKTIFGQDVSLADFFNAAGFALGMFLDLMHDVLRVVENTIIGFQVMGEQIGLLLSGQFEEFINFDAAGEIRKRIDLKDTIQENQLAVKQYIAQWDKARELELSGHISEIGMTADQWDRATRAKSNYMRPQGLAGSADSMERQLQGVTKAANATSAAVAAVTGTGTGAKAADKPAGPTGIQAYLQKAQEEAQVASKRLALIGAGLGEAVADAIIQSSDPINAANEALALIAAGQISILDSAFNASAAGVAWWANYNKDISDELTRIAEENAAREKEILDKRKAALESFQESVTSIFGGIKDSILSAFSLPDLGKSVNSITKNIQSLLRKTRDFAKNITTLSEQGLTSDLLQQVIQAGPLAGGALAQALVGGGSGFVGQLNEAYGEFSGIAGGIAGVGTSSMFGREQVVNNFNIEVNTVAGDPVAIERVVLDAISRANRRGTTGLTV